MKTWDNSFLDSMQGKTDPYAEAIIKDIMDKKDFKLLGELFTGLSKNSDEIVKDKNLPESVIHYFSSGIELPPWANQKKIELAQSLYARFAPQIALILNFKALPLCYACKNGAKVLAQTKRLVETKNHNTDRVALMVMNVMSPGGFSPKGKAIITIKKVRLYHAAIREFLLIHHKWDSEKYGQPINQEEMAGTAMAFSALVISGLEQLGAKLSDEEKDAYIHCWNIVSFYLGIDEQLYPETSKSGWDLGITIIEKNCEENEFGRELTHSLIDFSVSVMATGLITKLLFKNMPYFLIQWFTADVSKQIKKDIPKTIGSGKKLNWFTNFSGKIFIKILSKTTKEEQKHYLFQEIYIFITKIFLQSLINKHLKPSEKDFQIPASLKEGWLMK
jgi:hypothetical protein